MSIPILTVLTPFFEEPCVTVPVHDDIDGDSMKRDKQLRQPRYLQIAAQLTAEIESEEYPVGTLLPTERELCGIHDCSRHTARAALRLLTERGLLARRQGSGSVVMASRSTGRYVQTVESLNELIRYTEDARLQIIDSPEVVDADALPQNEGIGPGTSWIKIKGLRRTDAIAPAICWTAIYLRADFDMIVPEIGKRPVPVYTLVEEATGERIREVIQSLDAISVPRAISELLDCPARSPALKTTRRYVGENRQTLMIAESIHPAGRTRFVTTLHRQPTGENIDHSELKPLSN
jgi:GntR family transcriptional regulator